MQDLHPYYHHLLATHMERLVAPHLDETAWLEQLTYYQDIVLLKERIWLRTPGLFTSHCTPYLHQIELLLELTMPPLKHMMHYRAQEEREDYTRLTHYRGALIAEHKRITHTLEQLQTYTQAKQCATNDDMELSSMTSR